MAQHMTLFGLLALAPAAGICQGEGRVLPEIDGFSYVLGTQTFGAAYQFTDESRLVETAQATLDMGSNILKFAMSKSYHGRTANVPEPTEGIGSLTGLARDEPSHRRVLEMPFAYYLIWAYPFTPGWWAGGFSEEDRQKEYDEIYTFACYLLSTYGGTGKRFYLGHWEGDWHLRQGYDTNDDSVVKPEAVEGMIDWLNTRQRAIDDAKRDTPHAGVDVFGYVEVNLVRIAMEGRPSVTNDVIPDTNIDYVSYSSYDSGVDLGPALSYIESKLPPKVGIEGKRVFIGEYGFPTERHTPHEQDHRARQVMRAALEWGCPFVLYWELYNNEVRDDGRQRGFWMIDDEGEKQPVYGTHRRFYSRAREWATAFREREGREPSAREFGTAAVQLLDTDPFAGSPTIAGVPVFPNDNPWNTDISDRPVHSDSEAYVASIGSDGHLHPDFGTVWQGAPAGIPFAVVPGAQPRVPIEFQYPDESDPGPYPIPPDAPIEGGPQSDGDRHVLVLDRDNALLYEAFHCFPEGDGWRAGSGAVFDLTSNDLRPAGWTSADAAGLPIVPGLVRYDEVADGEIRHALRFTCRRTQRGYIPPATHWASRSDDRSLPPMGLRMRLKADFDISGFPEPVQVILTALKRYGMIVADNGGDWFISGAPDPRWDDEALQAIKRVPGSAFEAVDTGPLVTE